MKVLSRWQFGVTITYHFLFVPLPSDWPCWWR
jgi:cytochrome bd-type quinol oxidase subunit 1